MLRRVSRITPATALKNVSKRSYVVSATTDKPTDDSKTLYLSTSVIERKMKIAQREQSALTILQLMQPFKMTPEFLTFAKVNISKEIAATGYTKEVDISSQLESDTITASDDQIRAICGEDYKEIVSELFTQKPDLSPIFMDYYLKLNPEYFQKVQHQRSEAILKLCMSIAQKNAKK